MVGDSDEDFLPEEGADGEDDPLQVTAEELRRLRMVERQRQPVQDPGAALPQEEAEMQPEADSLMSLPPSSIPPWPTPLFSGPPPSEAAQAPTVPSLAPPQAAQIPTVPGLAQTAPAQPPMAPPAPVRRRTAPFSTPQAQTPGALSSQAGAAYPASFPGWRGFRRRSYWLVPLLLVVVFFLLLVAAHSPQAGAMLFIFAAIGVIQAAVLLYAPNDAFWAVGVVGGLLVFLSAAFFALFLPIFALILSILLLSLGGVALRERYYPVKEGTVAVMGLFGRYNRTLQPGFNLRAPGEKVLGVVETQRIRYEVRLPPITLFSGEQVTLSVAVTYQVVPGEEYLAIRTTKDWQKPIQQQLQAVVQDVISTLSPEDFRAAGGGHPLPGGFGAYGADDLDDEQDASPLGRINERLTQAMRRQVADRGVAVHAVRVHLLEGPQMHPGAQVPGQQPLTSHPTVALPAMPQGVGQVAESFMPGTPGAGSTSYLAPSAGVIGPPVTPAYSAGPPVAPPAVGAGVPPAGGPPEPMTLRSAQALAEMYKAVMDHRITDLTTISRIISQFEAVAADPELSQQVPFDAAAGAQNLMNHRYHLQMRAYEPLAQQPDGDAGFPPGAPVPPAAPEEE